MSALAILFAILSVMASPWGLLSILVGLTLFFLLPAVSAATPLKQPAHFMFWLAKQPLNRAAIVVSEHNDILLKPMRFDGIGVEVITIDGEEKVFEDPDSALHYWMGLPFTLADEAKGVLFDPRHAALGQRKSDLDEYGESEYHATESEWEHYGVSKWKPGVFEMPDAYELVNLSKIRELVDGGERSEYAKRVEELYKHSRDPFGTGVPAMQFLYPVIAFCAPFFGMWILASRLGVPGDGAASTISWGTSSILWLLLATRDPTPDGKSDGDDKASGFTTTILGVAAVAIPVFVFGAIAILVNWLLAIALLLGTVLGFLIIPVLSILSRPIESVSGAFANLYFRLGFMGYTDPVFEWTPTEYRLREARELDETAPRPTWYGLFGSKVGFTYTPGLEAWGAEAIKSNDVDAVAEIRADGGKEDTQLPRKYTPAPELQRANYGSFVPTRLKQDHYYLKSGVALARFRNSAVGEKSLRRLLEAKEKFGGENTGLSDKSVLYLSAASMFLGVILGVLFFIL